MPDASTRTGKVRSVLAPRYSERDVKLLQRFLAACLTTAEHALRQVRDLAGNETRNPTFQGNIKHWAGVCAGIRWAAYKACERQPHLVATGDAAIEAWEKHFSDIMMSYAIMNNTPTKELIECLIQRLKT